jgi:hypothetical protein
MLLNDNLEILEAILRANIKNVDSFMFKWKDCRLFFDKIETIWSAV